MNAGPARDPFRFVAALAAIALAAGIVWSAPLAVAATTCSVTNVTQGGAPGSDLQSAIDGANPGDKLQVTGMCGGRFTIAKNLTLVGKPTAQVPVPKLNGQKKGRVLDVTGGVTVVILSLTITNGASSGTFPDFAGGGIRNAGTLRLTNAVVRSSAADDGAGIYNAGSLTLTGSTLVTANKAEYDGGGIFNDAKLVMRDSSRVGANTAVNIGGGGIYNSGRLTMWDTSSVSGNGSGLSGGGIYNDTGNRVIMNDSSKVVNNDGSYGAGIANVGTATLNGSALIKGNDSLEGGGVLDSGTLTLGGSSLITGNTALSGGGVEVSNGATALLRNSASVTGNTATYGGGGVYVSGGTLEACDEFGVDEWVGALSPNTPDDPPTPTPATC